MATVPMQLGASAAVAGPARLQGGRVDRPCPLAVKRTARKERICVVRRAAPPEGADKGGDQPAAAGGQAGLSEDVLERLRKAEEEASKLREELAAARDANATDAPAAKSSEDKYKTYRGIDDASLRRETLFSGSVNEENWVSEGENFLTGGSPGEDASGGLTAEEQATVNRRLAIGVVGSLVLGGLALIPDDAILGDPKKPLYVYLVPLVRIEALLKDMKPLVENAEWSDVSLAVKRVIGAPNNARENLSSAARYLDGPQKTRAVDLTSSFMEYVQAIDYNKYYDTVTTPKGGEEAQKFVSFSLKSLSASQTKLAEFLALFPKDQVKLARDQLPPE
ncbi:unnamed protein product [Pedinophyceae sp. YPF-701]|nr:unnamed protein product [Pedinophyceae sp. YPF-701]